MEDLVKIALFIAIILSALMGLIILGAVAFEVVKDVIIQYKKDKENGRI